MIYKIAWKARKKFGTFEGIGPALGKVNRGVFIPDTFKKAVKRLKQCKNYKRARYYLVEGPFLPEDVDELQRIFPGVDDILFLDPTAQPVDNQVKFFDIEGREMVSNPFTTPVKELKKTPVEVEEDWDLGDEDMEDAVDEAALDMKLKNLSL